MTFRAGTHIASLLLAIVAGAAHAQVANAGFEADAKYSTTITGWDKLGHAFVSDSEVFSTPTEGSFQAALATGLDGSFGEPAGSGVSSATAEANIGIPTGSLATLGYGNFDAVSMVTQSITFATGDEFRFDYNFLTNAVYNDGTAAGEPFANRPQATANDFAFLFLQLGGTTQIVKLIDTFYGFQELDAGDPDGFNTGFVPTPSTDAFLSESGYLSYTFTAIQPGTYRIGFGVTDGYTSASNPLISSGLLVDNVRFVQAVPEPATFAALGLGLAALARRRKRG